MPNLLKFSMRKLCYDLVLEVIDELDPKDVPELMKVDRRFRWILLQKPARIFEKQIHSIHIEIETRAFYSDHYRRQSGLPPNVYSDLVSIMKIPESTALPFGLLSHHILLLSQVERCSVLCISDKKGDAFEGEELSGLKRVLENLKQVDELEVVIYGPRVSNCLENLKAEVTDRAVLIFSFSQEEVHQQLIWSLIHGRFRNCKMILVEIYRDDYFSPTGHSALSKTQVELFVIGVRRGKVKSTIELILNSGIPSENEGAACIVQGKMARDINNLTVDINNFPDIRQVNEPNIRTFIRDTMMEMLRKHRVEYFCWDRSSFDDCLNRDAIDCYWKRIDERRDCIYVHHRAFFFAKYVSPLQF